MLRFARSLAAGRRHPLHRAARAALLLLSLAGLWLGLREAAWTVERIRHHGPVVLPDDDAALRATLLGALATAVLRFDFDAGIRAALADDDLDRATLLHEVATRSGVTLAAGTAAAYAAATTPTARLWRALRDCGGAALTGHAASLTGLGCVLASDLALPLYADARDAAVQGGSWLAGRPVDPVILGLSLTGLGLAAAQPATDLVKATLRFRHVDDGLRAALRAEPANAAGELAGLWRAGGMRALTMSLREADDLATLALHRRVVAAAGSDGTAAIAVLGRRLPAAFRGWHVTRPQLVRLALAGSLAALAGALLLSHLAPETALRAARRLGLDLLAWRLGAVGRSTCPAA
jgi:hypothetical protein